jgi:uncharacterized Zn finger protein
MTHRRCDERKWWQQVVVCCPGCGSVSVRYRKTDQVFVCGRCGDVSAWGIVSKAENRLHIAHLRATWRASGR